MFPKYKVVKINHSFLGFKWSDKKKIKDNWEDLGYQKDQGSIKDGRTVYTHTSCSVCNSRVKIGKQNGETFLFCNICKAKIV